MQIQCQLLPLHLPRTGWPYDNVLMLSSVVMATRCRRIHQLPQLLWCDYTSQQKHSIDSVAGVLSVHEFCKRSCHKTKTNQLSHNLTLGLSFHICWLRDGPL